MECYEIIARKKKFFNIYKQIFLFSTVICKGKKELDFG